MKDLKSLIPILLLVLTSRQAVAQNESAPIKGEDLKALLETVFELEQLPLRARDSLMAIHGVEHEAVEAKQAIFRENHVENEVTIRALLDSQ